MYLQDTTYKFREYKKLQKKNLTHYKWNKSNIQYTKKKIILQSSKENKMNVEETLVKREKK